MPSAKVTFSSKSVKFAIAALAASSFTQHAIGQGRREDVIIFEGERYDGACLYRLAINNKGVPDEEYVPLMVNCLWNGVENPSAPGIPYGKTYNCNSVPCVRQY